MVRKMIETGCKKASNYISIKEKDKILYFKHLFAWVL
jgi:hypothetical protein